ncbi:MAG: uroporphyrinogen-III C-methyltransferase [Candidatus Riflebacteria bacterium]|nr:uroporphyrinogen-III C-methyltransferase [Candidatus Riflebacteria bacterium]
MKKGIVYLVGSGPGDPGLLTLRAKELLEKADVIVYDRLGADEVLPFANPEAELIDVGKIPGLHNTPQEIINEIIRNKALEGRTVVRLKGGDPFVFGRVSEELTTLCDAGVDYEVVSGVSSAIAGPAYAGIPLTDRKFASSVVFVTGHEAEGKTNSNIPWQSISGIDSIVILMGIGNLSSITQKLIQFGRNPESSVAIIEKATTPLQRTVEGTLASISEIAIREKVTSPALIVIGDTVSQRSIFKWYEKRPLFGRSLILTRPLEQSRDLSDHLRKLGAAVHVCPTIKIQPIECNQTLTRFFSDIGNFRDLVFTSINGVRIFWEKLFGAGYDARLLSGKNILCIGPSTSAEMKKYGIKADFVPEKYVAEEIIPWFKKRDPARVALLRAEKAREILPLELEKAGYSVEIITLYKTIFTRELSVLAKEKLVEGKIDGVLFTSSSTVESFAEAIAEAGISNSLISAFTIGPVTSDTCRIHGIKIVAEASEYTSSGLAEAVKNYFINTMKV